MKCLFAYFGKEDSEWLDDRSAECLMTYWFIKKQFLSPCRLAEFDLKIEQTSGHI
jgi:hypothetical protein